MFLLAGGHSWKNSYAEAHGPLTTFLSSRPAHFIVSENNHVSLSNPSARGEGGERMSGPFGAREKAFELPVKRNDRPRRGRKIYQYGNYESYYGYRNPQEIWTDARLPLLKRKWFRKKRCLDIGCNAGILTIQVAKQFKCQHILGIDIDAKLIAKAEKHKKLRGLEPTFESNQRNFKTAGQGRSTSASSQSRSLPASDTFRSLSLSSSLPTTQRSSQSSKLVPLPSVSSESKSQDMDTFASQSVRATWGESELETTYISGNQEKDMDKFPNNVSFRHGNILEIDFEGGNQGAFDVVLCLSVTKWIHFNWKDKGIKQLFNKIWDWLSPGGLLILEPQPWKSYRKKFASLTPQIKENYHTIELRPSQFLDHLKKMGFKLVRELRSGETGKKKGKKKTTKRDETQTSVKRGFARPVFLLRKPDPSKKKTIGNKKKVRNKKRSGQKASLDAAVSARDQKKLKQKKKDKSKRAKRVKGSDKSLEAKANGPREGEGYGAGKKGSEEERSRPPKRGKKTKSEIFSSQSETSQDLEGSASPFL